MSTDKYPWPQWQLSAFVLDELEPDVAAQIQSAAANDPSLAAEIAAIRETVAQVTQLYKHETTGIQPTKLDVALTSSSNDPVVFTKNTGGRTNWTAVAALLAMAASMMIAFFLAVPALKNYFAQSKDVLANADIAQQIATVEAEYRERIIQTEQEIDALSKKASSNKSSAEVDPSTSEQMESLVKMYNDLMSRKRYAEAEVVAKRVSQLDPRTVRRGLQVASGSSSNANSNVKRKEEAYVDALTDVKQVAPVAPSLSREDRRLLEEHFRRADPTHASVSSAPGASSPKAEASMKSSAPTRLSVAGGMMGGMEGTMGMDGGMEGGMGYGGMGGGMGGKGSGMGAGMGGEGGMGMAGGGYGGASQPSSRPEPNYLADDVQYFSDNAPASDAKTDLALIDAAPNASFDHEGELADRMSLAKNDRRRYSMPRDPSNDRFAPIYENPFKFVDSDPLTTFSIDVDTASYVKARQFLLQAHSLPPANAVRVEEFINYFEYEYSGPKGDDPFSANLAVATCPWRTDHKLVRIALQAKKMDVSERPKANIVFLLDVSGSMDEPNKLPLVKESMRMLIQQLGENDRVAMVVYAGAAGCVLESTTGDKQDVILGALDRLNAGGSTNGGQGIQLAYDIARDHFVPGGVNRVILCTDGDFNVGTTSTEGLVNLVVENAKSKVFLTVLGFGMGNTNDAMMEQISDKGNGVYGFVDSRREAQRQMIKQLAGNLMTVAKDVKIQVEFNPERVASYRLIGYENRKLANEDFANDKKDAGEIGAGHRVTALYEIEPIGASKVQPAEGLRYQKRKPEVAAEPKNTGNEESSNELLAVNLRYKQPEGDTSKLLTFPLVDADKPFSEVDQDFKWAASVAQFAMLLRSSTHKGNASWSGLLESAESLATDESRRECVNMIRTAAALSRK